MRTLVIFAAIVAVATGTLPVNLPSTCAAVLCQVGTICREIFDPNTGVIQAQCIPIRPPRPSCRTVKCSLGKQCVLKEVQCFAPPCHPVPECVDKDKAGKCPAPPPPIDTKTHACKPTFECADDSDCEGRDKCCVSFCSGRACRAPSTRPDPPSCATHECEAGQKCVMQDVRCVKPPCPQQPVCVPIEMRPGTCPKPSGLAGICVFRPGVNCLEDSECPKGKKCCSEGCGKVCKDAIPAVTVKPGRCPAVRHYTSSQGCRSTCSRDSECSGDDKCCRTGCGGKVCQKPQPVVQPPPPPPPSCKHILCPTGETCVQEVFNCVRAPCPQPLPRCVPNKKPGACPRIPYSLIKPACAPSPNCRSDAQCPGAQKCCPSHCGDQCKDPQVPPRCGSKVCRVDEKCVLKRRCDRYRPRPCSIQSVCEAAGRPTYRRG